MASHDYNSFYDLSLESGTSTPTQPSSSKPHSNPATSDFQEDHSIPQATQHIYSHIRTSSNSSLHSQNDDCEAAADMPGPPPERSWIRKSLIIATLCGISIVSCMSTGAFTISLPRIAEDVNLAPNFVLWPASIYSLTGGCTILLMGSIADQIGNRLINILGCFLIGLFILASGLSQTGLQLIIFRGVQGIGMSMAYPTAFSILAHTFAPGSWRNYAFACLGLSQPLGWSLGLILGGLGEGNALGWRFAFYLSAGMSMFLGAVNIFILPADEARASFEWARFSRSIDWLGLLISSGCIGSLCYVFATYANDFVVEVQRPLNIALLIAGLLLVPTFAFWMRQQEKRGRPALIPNSIWGNRAFTSICFVVILAWGALQCIELFLSLFFQEVQKIDVLGAAVRFLPNVVIGCALNILTGYVVAHLRCDWLVVSANTICAMAPLILALVDPKLNYWKGIFWAVALSPVSADIVFTVANLIIADVFPDETQALAGAVFHTVSQFGSAIGLAVAAVVSGNVTRGSLDMKKPAITALTDGYRAVFWLCFAAGLLASVIGLFGLRGIGRVGKTQREAEEQADGVTRVASAPVRGGRSKKKAREVRISQVPLCFEKKSRRGSHLWMNFESRVEI